MSPLSSSRRGPGAARSAPASSAPRSSAVSPGAYSATVCTSYAMRSRCSRERESRKSVALWLPSITATVPNARSSSSTGAAAEATSGGSAGGGGTACDAQWPCGVPRRGTHVGACRAPGLPGATCFGPGLPPRAASLFSANGAQRRGANSSRVASKASAPTAHMWLQDAVSAATCSLRARMAARSERSDREMTAGRSSQGLGAWDPATCHLSYSLAMGLPQPKAGSGWCARRVCCARCEAPDCHQKAWACRHRTQSLAPGARPAQHPGV